MRFKQWDHRKQISLAGGFPHAGGLNPQTATRGLVRSFDFVPRKAPQRHTHWSGRTALSLRVSFPWMPWHSSGGMSTACGDRRGQQQPLVTPPTLGTRRAAHLGALALVLLHDEVTEGMVLAHEENVTTEAVPPAWRKDGNGAGAHSELGESFERSLRTREGQCLPRAACVWSQGQLAGSKIMRILCSVQKC